MARVPQVTRTIKSTKVKLLAVNETTKAVEEIEMVLPRTYNNDNAILKKAIKLNDREEIKLVSVIESSVEENRYGMLETEFIKVANVLEEEEE